MANINRDVDEFNVDGVWRVDRNAPDPPSRTGDSPGARRSQTSIRFPGPPHLPRSSADGRPQPRSEGSPRIPVDVVDRHGNRQPALGRPGGRRSARGRRLGGRLHRFPDPSAPSPHCSPQRGGPRRHGPAAPGYEIKSGGAPRLPRSPDGRTVDPNGPYVQGESIRRPRGHYPSCAFSSSMTMKSSDRRSAKS